LNEEQLQRSAIPPARLESFEYSVDMMSIREKALRCELARFIQRGYRQRLVTSATGSFSARIDGQSFLITPHPLDRQTIEPEDLVMIRKGKKQVGCVPSRAVAAHQAIYDASPEVMAIINATPVNALAFSICGARIDSRTIPESYVFVGDVAVLPFETIYSDHESLARTLSLKHPAAVLANNGVILVGDVVLSVFDKLEVIECSAEAIIDSQPIGGHVPMGEGVIEELRQAFDL
jgi:L-fuculose-phosphate aldolase